MASVGELGALVSSGVWIPDEEGIDWPSNGGGETEAFDDFPPDGDGKSIIFTPL